MSGGNAGLAEAGSLQLEWFTLSARTKNQIYKQKALRVFDSIHKANPDQVQRAVAGVVAQTHESQTAEATIHVCMHGPSVHHFRVVASSDP